MNRMNGLKRWFLNLYYEFYYRKVDRDVCCCGSRDCIGDWSHSYVSAKNYTIEREVKSKLDKQA